MKKRFGAENVIYAQGSSLTGPPVEPIPGDALKDNSGQPGLTAEYFHGTLRAGTEGQQQTSVMTRTDREINFAWADGAGAELKQDFSVRWTGTLTPPTSGDYLIGFTGTDAFHFWLDNQLIGESWYSDTSKTRLKTVHLEADHAYPVKIECSQEGRSGLARLVWHEPGDKNDYTEAVQKADLIVAGLGFGGEIGREENPIHIVGFEGGGCTRNYLSRAQQQ